MLLFISDNDLFRSNFGDTFACSTDIFPLSVMCVFMSLEPNVFCSWFTKSLYRYKELLVHKALSDYVKKSIGAKHIRRVSKLIPRNEDKIYEESIGIKKCIASDILSDYIKKCLGAKHLRRVSNLRSVEQRLRRVSKPKHSTERLSKDVYFFYNLSTS